MNITIEDKIEVQRKNYSTTSGRSTGGKHDSESENVSIVDKPIIDPQLFQSLAPEQAVALLSVGGHSMDDVINVKSMYV